MNEFELIDEIVRVLGEVTEGPSVVVGPGDDSAALRVPEGQLLISSIDALVSGVHFPETADPHLIGYRAIMVSVSDLAAMGAEPAQILVALTFEPTDADWVIGLASGMREATIECGARLVGGNLALGARAITVSVHGFCPADVLLTRTGAGVGDALFVTGELGAAAAALRTGALTDQRRKLSAAASAYFRPKARVSEGILLRGVATAAIDVSDGLLQDLDHLCTASGVGAMIQSASLPVASGAELADALSGGDEYELLFTASCNLSDLPVAATQIGSITGAPGVQLDGQPVDPVGYRHFS